MRLNNTIKPGQRYYRVKLGKVWILTVISVTPFQATVRWNQEREIPYMFNPDHADDYILLPTESDVVKKILSLYEAE